MTQTLKTPLFDKLLRDFIEAEEPKPAQRNHVWAFFKRGRRNGSTGR